MLNSGVAGCSVKPVKRQSAARERLGGTLDPTSFLKTGRQEQPFGTRQQDSASAGVYTASARRATALPVEGESTGCGIGPKNQNKNQPHNSGE
jgi:hypothetical protein